MEYMLDELLGRYEAGRISRRELVRVLALTLGAGGVAGAAPANQKQGFKASAVNHISYRVSDYERTRDFYADLLGMQVGRDDGKSCTLAFGDSFIVAREVDDSAVKPVVDHFAITIDDWDKDAVEAELERRGLSPRPDTENSFIVKDPEGYSLQISGRAMKA